MLVMPEEQPSFPGCGLLGLAVRRLLRSYFKTGSSVILNEVKDLNPLKR